ncbi:1-Cys peroxiredoxin [Cinnamomum micranthum f. kanehirae]|uniref:Peroxiredoxin n=1 Tax=Cinnamomum micranthum f. kanehirae TaxID=337451 RepID=A0A3S3N228_9MAGN|nr:1-Cys peroxiredoxin [Cinnamomum micranthum f. kanehirae]
MPARSRNTSTETLINPFHLLKVRHALCFLGPKMPGLTIGDTIPNLEVNTTHGKFKIHDLVGDGWAIIFSHPGDFTPVCTTELAKMAQYLEEFEKRGVKLLGLSCDDLQSHTEWIKDIEAFTGSGCKVRYPIVADPNREIIKQLNMVDPDEKDSNGNSLPSRALHIVGPDKKVKLSFLYPASTGRNMDEVLRAVESLLKAAKHKVATPCNWKPGDPVVISPGVSNEKAKEMFPHGFETVNLPSKKDYLRFTNV